MAIKQGTIKHQPFLRKLNKYSLVGMIQIREYNFKVRQK